MKTLGVVFLSLIALFTGGCSLFFIVVDGALVGPGTGVFGLIQPGGLIIGGLCVWWAWHIYKRPLGVQSVDADQPPDDKS